MRVETVHRVSVDCGVVGMVPAHCHLHKERVFVLLCVTVLDVKASVVVSVLLLCRASVQTASTGVRQLFFQ